MTDTSHSFGALIVVCGRPGVGKSTVAKTLVDEVGATHLQADEIREERFEEPRYDPDAEVATYEALFDAAADVLDRGGHVVLDATFGDSERRETAEDVAWRAGAEFRLLKVEADADVVGERVDRAGDDGSDAGGRVHDERTREFDAVPDDVTVVDNSGDVSATQQAVRRWLRESLRARHRDGRGPGI